MRSSDSAADVYDDIVLAANLFSQNQTGALIVIEREIGLRTYIESGVPLDARLSYDLLATLFRPSAPLHDGAAIIQGDRIAAAACFLPLSMNPVLSTQTGNPPSGRHRHHGRNRCSRRHHLGRDRSDQPGGGGKHRARPDRRAAARALEQFAAPVRPVADLAEPGGRQLHRRRAAQYASSTPPGHDAFVREGATDMAGFFQRYFVHHLGFKADLAAAGHRAVGGGRARPGCGSGDQGSHRVPQSARESGDRFRQLHGSAGPRARPGAPHSSAGTPATCGPKSTSRTFGPGERTFDLTSRQVRVPQDLEVVQIIPSQFQLSFDSRMTRSVEVRPRVIGTFASRDGASRS